MKRFISKKTVALGLTAGLVLGAGGAAFAFWTTAGSGIGSATTGTEVSNLKISDTTSILDMAPGIAPETISGTIKNLNAVGGQNQQVNNVTVSIAGVTETPAALAAYGTDGTIPGTSGIAYLCSAADYSLSLQSMAVNTDLTPGQSVSFSGAKIGFSDNTGQNQNACQGATVNLSYASN